MEKRSRREPVNKVWDRKPPVRCSVRCRRIVSVIESLAKLALLLTVVPGVSCGKPEVPSEAPKVNLTSVAEQEAPAESKRVFVVINKASQDSIAVGAYYVQKRSIPKSNVVMTRSPARISLVTVVQSF